MISYLTKKLCFIILFFFMSINGMSEKKNGLQRQQMYDAISHGDLLEIDRLVCLIDVNYTEKNNKWSLLHSATSYGSLSAMQILISNGANVNAQDNQGKTPLVRAVENVDLEKIKLLILHKAKLTLGTKTSDALYYAGMTYEMDNQVKPSYRKLQKSVNDIHEYLLQIKKTQNTIKCEQKFENLNLDEDEVMM